MYIKKAHLNVKGGVEDVVGVPLGGDSDPPTMRAQHPFHFQISCHLKVERKCQLCHLCSFLVSLRSISTFPVSWLVTPPDVNWTPELDLPWRYNCYDLKIIFIYTLTSSLTSPKWNPLPNTSLAAFPRSPYVGGAIL